MCRRGWESRPRPRRVLQAPGVAGAQPASHPVTQAEAVTLTAARQPLTACAHGPSRAPRPLRGRRAVPSRRPRLHHGARRCQRRAAACPCPGQRRLRSRSGRTWPRGGLRAWDVGVGYGAGASTRCGRVHGANRRVSSGFRPGLVGGFRPGFVPGESTGFVRVSSRGESTGLVRGLAHPRRASRQWPTATADPNTPVVVSLVPTHFLDEPSSVGAVCGARGRGRARPHVQLARTHFRVRRMPTHARPRCGYNFDLLRVGRGRRRGRGHGRAAGGTWTRACMHLRYSLPEVRPGAARSHAHPHTWVQKTAEATVTLGVSRGTRYHRSLPTRSHSGCGSCAITKTRSAFPPVDTSPSFLNQKVVPSSSPTGTGRYVGAAHGPCVHVGCRHGYRTRAWAR